MLPAAVALIGAAGMSAHGCDAVCSVKPASEGLCRFWRAVLKGAVGVEGDWAAVDLVFSVYLLSAASCRTLRDSSAPLERQTAATIADDPEWFAGGQGA